VTLERAVFWFVGLVCGVVIVALAVLVRAWRDGWRNYEQAEAAACGYENDDLV
jgi:hypothetical protein